MRHSAHKCKFLDATLHIKSYFFHNYAQLSTDIAKILLKKKYGNNKIVLSHEKWKYMFAIQTGP